MELLIVTVGGPVVLTGTAAVMDVGARRRRRLSVHPTAVLDARRGSSSRDDLYDSKGGV